MVKTITVDGKSVTFKASAAIPRMYRLKFRRDIMQDMKDIEKATQEPGLEGISPRLLDAFENMAFLMAKHATPDEVPETVEEWLDGFDTFSIYAVFPVISEMWDENVKTMSIPAKK